MFSDKIAYLKDINLHKSIINLSLFGCRVLFLFDLCRFLSLKHTARRVMNAKTPISSKIKQKKDSDSKRIQNRRGISGCLGGDLGFLGNKWN
jgi:hypothetical protein